MWQKESHIYYQDFIARVAALMYFFVGAAALLFFYLFITQIIKGDYYWKRSEQNRLFILPEKSPRGRIYDRAKKVLAESSASFGAVFYPFLGTAATIKETSGKLSEILQQPEYRFTALISESVRSGKAVQLAKTLGRPQFFAIKEQQESLAGVSIDRITVRHYGAAEINSHLLGYMGEADRVFLERFANLGYKSGDQVGKAGIESRYDLFLRGQDGGWQVEVDVIGKQKRLYNYIQPVQGNDLQLNIDAELQAVAYEAIRKTGHSGAAVGIEPQTGRVRLLVSVPGFDSNLSFLQNEESAKFWKKVLGDPQKPLLNRAVVGLYPPGSVFKIITVLAAIKEAGIPEETRFYCNGKFEYGGRTFKCWKKEGHGRLDMAGAFANSCNVYFYQLGLRVGAKNLLKYARMFNLDKKTGIDYPHEKSGNVPLNLEKLFGGESINLAIGQGPILVTPLQLAHLAATVANRGKFMKPLIADSVFSHDGEKIFSNNPDKTGEIQLEPAVWGRLVRYMTSVVSEGTGRACYIDGLPVAGKTGTAQNPLGKDHAWFVCFAPADEPKLALAVLVEHGGSGGATAAPIARRILSHYFEKKFSEADASEEYGN